MLVGFQISGGPGCQLIGGKAAVRAHAAAHHPVQVYGVRIQGGWQVLHIQPRAKGAAVFLHGQAAQVAVQSAFAQVAVGKGLHVHHPGGNPLVVGQAVAW